MPKGSLKTAFSNENCEIVEKKQNNSDHLSFFHIEAHVDHKHNLLHNDDK